LSDIIFPPYLYPDDESVEVIDTTTTIFRPQFAPGVTQRQEQAAPYLRVSQKYSGMSVSERAALLSFARQTRGRVNGVYLTPLRYALRGSFPAAELLTNNTFANGTTGWSSDSEWSTSVSDRVYQATRNNNTGASTYPLLSSTVAATQYAPYVMRAFIRRGRGFSGATVAARINGTNSNTDSATADGLSKVVLVGDSATSISGGALVVAATSGQLAGDSLLIPYTSLSRCALVDNGANFLLRSDEMDNASWTKTRSTVAANATTAPDGTATAESIVEDSTASNTHTISQAVTVAAQSEDYAFSVALHQGTRTWARLIVRENTGNSSVAAYFNLATGVVGTTSVGANWSNVRTFVVSLGNNWYQCCVVARKTNSASSLTAFIGLATGDNADSYTGNGTSELRAWRATLAQSSVATRLTQTTSAALSTGTSQTGAGCYVKGLPVSTSGLLLPGDLFQAGSELKQAVASFDSDAAGLGYLQFEPPLFRSPADNDPVIIQQPFGKFILGDNSKIANRLGRYADITLSFEELYE
jgi:hypothetical protein